MSPAAAFPPDFVWGVASSSHQVEGAMEVDGGGRSIWDTFASVPGAIRGGDTGAGGVDHRRRWEEDVDLMASLGVGAYRFSIAWPRVQPGGRGALNERGVDFYRSLVDRLLDRGITPVATLYHWDLPDELESDGGWPTRDVALRFAEYAALVGEALGDRVAHWRTINEPWCSAMLGYAAGIHAPGRRSPAAAVAAAHHLLLGHGLAVAALRGVVRAPGAEIGLTVNPYPVVAAGSTPADLDVARRVDGIANRVWLDPVLRGAYPADVVEDWAGLGFADVVHDGDLDVISAPIDALGLNYYRRHHVRHAPEERGGRDWAQWPGTAHVDLVEPDGPHTDGGWAIEPEGLFETLEMVAAYGDTPLYVEECGAAFDEPFDDVQRIDFLRSHITQAHRAREAGVDLRGWFVWTWFDNFEWAEGYAHRFGLVHVDYATYARTPKASARWYAEVMRTGEVG
ncbi:beta-glucosidase [Iamia sp. SCSIO 61187]|uniref:GH1 family beta-glucosidase n=1 Tax=Iamia sp. SCSIO 61187 TaxID=2722752 RepID=UPI001C62CC8F|nr:GH1 family beta-glucosidase [Iamia sp. SCSIO 61187]QYG91968.1 beta-glucosidase [Iamia sp. SCSIO 61187]